MFTCLVLNSQDFFLITGGSSDIGIACTLRLKSLGINCISLLNPTSPIPDCLPTDSYYLADLADPLTTSQIIKEITNLYPITSFISLASINHPASFSNFTDEDILKHVAINAIAPLRIARDLIPCMRSTNFGRLTFTSSIGVKFGGAANHLPYSFSKFSSEFLPSELLALASENIFTNVVRIGVTNTRRFRSYGKNISDRVSLIPAKRMADPQEIADFLVWLSSKENRFMTGQIVHYSGGE